MQATAVDSYNNNVLTGRPIEFKKESLSESRISDAPFVTPTPIRTSEATVYFIQPHIYFKIHFSPFSQKYHKLAVEK